MTRARGPLLDYRPQQATRDLLDPSAGVLTEYAEHLPLTLRQLFYRLVATAGYPKTEKDYARLCERARRQRPARRHHRPARNPRRRGDDAAAVRVPGPAGFWATVADDASLYRRERLGGQQVRVEVWCEAAGMLPQPARVAHHYGVPVVSSSGFDSLTAKVDAARPAADDPDRPLTVLHVGDLDPSGVHLFTAAEQDVTAWAEHYGGTVRFHRLAITPAQVEAFGLPTTPPKASDRRSFTGETCQAEAHDPAQLAQLLRSGPRVGARPRPPRRAARD